MAFILTGVTCATVIGAPLGTFIAGLASWRAVFAATGALVALALLAGGWLVPSLPSEKALRIDDPLSLSLSLLPRPHVRQCLLMIALMCGAHFCSYTYITPFLLRDGHFALSDITLLLLAFGAIGFVSDLAISPAVKHRLKPTTAAVVALLMMSLVLLPTLSHSYAHVPRAGLHGGIAFGALPLCASIWSQHAAPDLPEAGSALLVSTSQVAIAVSSSVGGVVVEHICVAGARCTAASGAARRESTSRDHGKRSGKTGGKTRGYASPPSAPYLR
jgi:predicted MFS family arabinose efflux permease